MARECAICGTKKMMGHTKRLLRGHTNITAIRSFKPNLQKVKIDGVSVKVCPTCRRSLTKEARMLQAQKAA